MFRLPLYFKEPFQAFPLNELDVNILLFNIMHI